MRPEPGGTYYEYIAVYVDDLAIAAKDPQAFCNELKMISCASLRGANFCADSRKVHQLLKNYLVAESAEQWIRDMEHLNNG